MSLLEKAKKIELGKKRTRSKFNDEELFELAMAWVKDEITTTQGSKAITGNGTASGNYLYYMASAMKWGFQNGRLKEIKK